MPVGVRVAILRTMGERMANQEHLAILKKGVEAWNRWRVSNPAVKPELSSADLHGAVLEGANLKWASLPNSNFMGADLTSAVLDGANFEAANLSASRLDQASMMGSNFVAAILVKTVFRGARFVGANLSNADLSGADLWGADIFDTDMRNADLSEATFRDAILDNVDVSRATLARTDMVQATFRNVSLGSVDIQSVKGLESVRHLAPSMVGLDTIYLSNGNVPEKFLRGIGAPDAFITYMKSLVANPIEFYSCFISYSTRDQEFAERLHGDLQNRNVRCWFAPHDVQGGKKLHEQIDEAIRVHEKVLLILSAESMNSEWVKTEIAKARRREVREKKQVLFPVRLVPFEAIRDWECFDADAGKDSAREIREYFIPDFSEWKEHDKYKKAFERLLADLKAGEKR
jgi:uncharacterized protein YjbI with pentapeptide repeats